MLKEYRVETDGALSIGRRDSEPSPWWWDLRFHGNPITVIGGSCGTCEALFENLEYTQGPIAPTELAGLLNMGLTDFSSEILQTLKPLLIAGLYWAGVIKTKLTPSANGVPPGVGCRAERFWWRPFEESPKHRLYELMLPSTKLADLEPYRITWYEERIKEGQAPTVLALTIFDERVVHAEYREGALAHFILDGHHKIEAAGRLGAPIQIASLFLAQSQIAWLDPGLYEASLRSYYEAGTPLTCPPQLLATMT